MRRPSSVRRFAGISIDLRLITPFVPLQNKPNIWLDGVFASLRRSIENASATEPGRKLFFVRDGSVEISLWAGSVFDVSNKFVEAVKTPEFFRIAQLCGVQSRLKNGKRLVV